MKNLFARRFYSIGAGQTVSGFARQAQTIHVTCGKVWITIEGMPQDHWLFAGDSLTVPPGRRIVIEADQFDSRVDFPTGFTRRAFDWRGRLRGCALWLIGNKTIV
ncbi:MAG: DUF2917 domain-containing protein [Pseudomonadota bacterium]